MSTQPALDPHILYERDFAAWLVDQANALRQIRPDTVDWENVAGQLDGILRDERIEVLSRARSLMTTLLKWQYHAYQRRLEWLQNIGRQRRWLDIVLEASPSLASPLSARLDTIFPAAVRIAYEETDASRSDFPNSNPYDLTMLLDWRYPDDLGPPASGWAD